MTIPGLSVCHLVYSAPYIYIICVTFVNSHDDPQRRFNLRISSFCHAFGPTTRIVGEVGFAMAWGWTAEAGTPLARLWCINLKCDV